MVLSVAVCIFGRVVFVPFALALLFALLLAPIITFLERINLPRLVAIFLVVFALFGLTGVLGWITSQQIVDLTNQLPTYKQTLDEKIRALPSVRSVRLTKASDTITELEKEIAKAVPGASPALARKTTQANLDHPLPTQWQSRL